MHVTATEIRLRMGEAQPQLQRHQAAVEHLFIWPLIRRIEMFIAVRKAWVPYNPQLLLTYTPRKD